MGNTGRTVLGHRPMYVCLFRQVQQSQNCSSTLLEICLIWTSLSVLEQQNQCPEYSRSARNSSGRVLFELVEGYYYQGQVCTEGILHLVNPNLGLNSGMQIFEPQMLWPNSGVKLFLVLCVVIKRAPQKFTLKKCTAQTSHQKFTPEFGLKISHCTSAGPFNLLTRYLYESDPTPESRES